MQLLGNVQEVTVDGRLVVRATFTPKLKEAVFDNRKRPLGRIVRIFGPVGSPYVTVEPIGDAGLLSAVGRQVYIEGVENHGKQKGSGR